MSDEQKHVERYRGVLAEHDYGDSMDVLWLDNDDDLNADEPLARRIENDIANHGRYLSVRYWISDRAAADAAIEEAAARLVMGDSEVEFTVHSSDITGYLWTDEEINVGGHDLLEELRSYKGRYCLLEITYER